MCILFRPPFKEAEIAVTAATNAVREYQTSQNEQFLAIAIAHYHHAYEKSGEKHNQFPDIIMNYAALLDKQNQLVGTKSNLKEVIRLLEEAQGVMDRKRLSQTEKYGVLLNNIGQAYLSRYRITTSGQDLETTKRTFLRARSHNRSSPVSLNYAKSLIGSATTLRTECELQSQGDDDLPKLQEAIDFLEVARNNRNLWLEYHRQIASIYDLRYAREEDRKDLDLSIEHYTSALESIPPGDPILAPTLFNLAKQLFERYKLTKNTADLTAAEQRRGEVKKLIDRLPGAGELKKQIQDLTEHMARRDTEDEFVVSDSPPGSRQPTSDFAYASSSSRHDKGASPSGSSYITTQPHTAEPFQYGPDRRLTLPSVSETVAHRRQTSDTSTVRQISDQQTRSVPSRKRSRPLDGEKMVQQETHSVSVPPWVNETAQPTSTPQLRQHQEKTALQYGVSGPSYTTAQPHTTEPVQYGSDRLPSVAEAVVRRHPTSETSTVWQMPDQQTRSAPSRKRSKPLSGEKMVQQETHSVSVQPMIWATDMGQATSTPQLRQHKEKTALQYDASEPHTTEPIRYGSDRQPTIPSGAEAVVRKHQAPDSSTVWQMSDQQKQSAPSRKRSKPLGGERVVQQETHSVSVQPRMTDTGQPTSTPQLRQHKEKTDLQYDVTPSPTQMTEMRRSKPVSTQGLRDVGMSSGRVQGYHRPSYIDLE